MAGRELSSLKKVAGIRCPGKKRLAMLWPENAPMGLIFFSRNEIGSELSCLSTAILRRGQGVVLGVRPSGQSDDDPSPPEEAQRIFQEWHGRLVATSSGAPPDGAIRPGPRPTPFVRTTLRMANWIERAAVLAWPLQGRRAGCSYQPIRRRTKGVPLSISPADEPPCGPFRAAPFHEASGHFRAHGEAREGEFRKRPYTIGSGGDT